MINDIANHRQKYFLVKIIWWSSFIRQIGFIRKIRFSDKSDLPKKSDFSQKLDNSLLSFPSRQATQNMALTLCPYDPKSAFVGTDAYLVTSQIYNNTSGEPPNFSLSFLLKPLQVWCSENIRIAANCAFIFSPPTGDSWTQNKKIGSKMTRPPPLLDKSKNKSSNSVGPGFPKWEEVQW